MMQSLQLQCICQRMVKCEAKDDLPLVHTVGQYRRGLHHVHTNRTFCVFLLPEIGKHTLSVDFALAHCILAFAETLDKILDVNHAAATRGFRSSFLGRREDEVRV